MAGQAVALPSSESRLASHQTDVWGKAVTYLILIILGVLMAFPFLWTITSSLKAGKTASISIRPKTAYRAWSPISAVRWPLSDASTCGL